MVSVWLRKRAVLASHTRDYKWKNISNATVDRNRWAEASSCTQKHLREAKPGSGSSKALHSALLSPPLAAGLPGPYCFCTGCDRGGHPSTLHTPHPLWQHLLTPLSHLSAAVGWDGGVPRRYCQSGWKVPGVEGNGSTTSLNNCNEPWWLKIAILILAQQSKACTEYIAENNSFSSTLSSIFFSSSFAWFYF